MFPKLGDWIEYIFWVVFAGAVVAVTSWACYALYLDWWVKK